jgi:tetratricopeptide (TPR) repeat protein
VLLLGASASARADETSTARHLLAGVRAFKAEHYDVALVELRVVARAPDAPADLAFYLGPTLVKLGRHREAIAVFVTSLAERDGLTAFYLGEAYYGLKLYRKSRAVFVGLRARGLGPVLDEAANRFIEAIDAAYVTSPVEATIDAYIAQAAELAAADPVVAAEIYDEARQVEVLATTHHRHAEILAALGATWNAAGRARAVVDALAGDARVSADVAWQVARAYATLGDTARARPLLETIANHPGPHAAEATALRNHLLP